MLPAPPDSAAEIVLERAKVNNRHDIVVGAVHFGA